MKFLKSIENYIGCGFGIIPMVAVTVLAVFARMNGWFDKWDMELRWIIASGGFLCILIEYILPIIYVIAENRSKR